MRSSLKYFLLICFATICIGLHSYSQVDPVDSLKAALKLAKHDTTRCNILSQLAETADDEEWPAFNEQLLQLAEKNAAINSSKKNFYLKHLSYAFSNVGYLAKQEGNIAKSLEYFQKSLKTDEEIKNKEGIANSLHNVAAIYIDLGNLRVALDYLHRSLKILEEVGHKKGIANSLNNLGFVYEVLGDTNAALENYQRSLKIQEEIDDKRGIGYSLNNIGGIYKGKALTKKKGTFERESASAKALEYYQKSLKIREGIQDKEGIALSYSNIGLIYQDRAANPDSSMHREQLLNKALDYFSKSLQIRESIKEIRGIAFSLNNLGSVWLEKGNLSEALNYANKDMKASKDLGYPECIKDAAILLKDIYKKKGNFKLAFEMYQLEIQMSDSISNAATKKESIKKQFQYDYEKKEAVANSEHKNELEKQQAIADEKNRKQKIIIWSVAIGLFLVIAFAGFIFKSLNTTRKQKALIEIKNKETELQKHLIEEKQKEIIDSITYARRIQRALITNENYIDKSLKKLQDKTNNKT